MKLKDKMVIIRQCKEDIMNSACSLWDVGRELRDNEGTGVYGYILLETADVVIMAMTDIEWMVKDYLEKEKGIGERVENDVLHSYNFLDLMLVDKKKVEFLKEHGFHDRLLYVHGELSKIWCDLWKANKKLRDLAMFKKGDD